MLIEMQNDDTNSRYRRTRPLGIPNSAEISDCHLLCGLCKIKVVRRVSARRLFFIKKRVFPIGTPAFVIVKVYLRLFGIKMTGKSGKLNVSSVKTQILPCFKRNLRAARKGQRGNGLVAL